MKSGVQIVKEFLGTEIKEFREFWKECSNEDKEAFKSEAAESLGYTKAAGDDKYEKGKR
jgi:hypothetical protein